MIGGKTHVVEGTVRLAWRLRAEYSVSQGRLPTEYRMPPEVLEDLQDAEVVVRNPERPWSLLPDGRDRAPMLFGVRIVPDASVPVGEIHIR